MYPNERKNMTNFAYNQTIEYIDGTRDLNFEAAHKWASQHNTTFEEDIDKRESFLDIRKELYLDPTTGIEEEKEVNYPTLKRFWIIGPEPEPYVEPEPTVDELKSKRRSERDVLMNQTQNRIDRYRNQKDLGIDTTDSEETYSLLLSYTQYLRDYPNSDDDWYTNSPDNFEVFYVKRS